ncbi:hypothetical protein CKJ70_26630 [Mycobacterium avium]|nr:hypothetical protein CKJ70_26630 [Mycobacterium avium]
MIIPGKARPHSRRPTKAHPQVLIIAPCIYIPSGAAAIYSPQSGEFLGPDGVKYTIEDSAKIGDDGWKEMLGPQPR